MELLEDGIKDYSFKVIIIGESAVGKTSLANRYCNNIFTDGYKATIGADFSNKIIKWSDTVRVNLQIWDLAGQERINAVIKAHFRHSDGVICVLDMNDSTSAVMCDDWFKSSQEKCTNHSGDQCFPPTICLGNKYDMFDKSIHPGYKNPYKRMWNNEEVHISGRVDVLNCDLTPVSLEDEEVPPLITPTEEDVFKLYNDDFREWCMLKKYHGGFLVSAFTGRNVDAAFEELIELMILRYDAEKEMRDIEDRNNSFKLGETHGNKSGATSYYRSCNKC
jgi:small GTP-binding protein